MTIIKNILTAVSVVFLFALHPSLNKGNTPITNLQHFAYGNTLNISTDSNIKRNHLEVKWICETQNAPCNDLIIYKNGVQINEIPSVKGNQKLIVFYDNEKIGEIHQNKSVENQSHDYNISFLINNKTISLKGEIIGPSPNIETSTTFASL